ncbi:MAG: amidase [Candidatus Nanopelagicales bacterium]
MSSMDHHEYAEHDATALAELIRTGQVSADEVLDAAIARANAVDKALNAIVVRRDDAARAEADAATSAGGPFAGVPFLVKDLDGMLHGEPYTASSRSLKDYRASLDSELFARYKRSGLVIFGKTNTPEFGIMGVTESELRGPCHNPWDLQRTPGGSSGGSAAAVAARIVPMAHAGDGGGSIRIPSSSCGIFGLKPTRGRMPMGPLVGQGWDGLVAPHVVSISVRDSAAVLDATHGVDVGAPYAEPPAPASFAAAAASEPGKLRIGYSLAAQLADKQSPENVAAVLDAVELLAELGHELVEVDLPLDREVVARAYLSIVAASIAADVLETGALSGRKVSSDDFEAATWFLRQVGDVLSARELEEAQRTAARLGRTIARFYDDHALDVHLSATTAAPPVLIGELAPSTAERAALATLRRASVGPVMRAVLGQLAANSLAKTPNTQVFNMTGQPAMSVPLFWDERDLPIGVQFAGRFGDEATLFSLAAQLERVRPWRDRIPAI